MKRFVDEEDDSYESSSDHGGNDSDEENPYADGNVHQVLGC